MRIALALLALTGTAHANTFDWGGDCSWGDGVFDQAIPYYQTATIGDVPGGKADVGIRLDSTNDVDIQLIDVETGTEIIAWPSGLLNGPGEECTTFHGVRYCYSGYNGDPSIGGAGSEWIRIEGDTNRPLVMRAFGYAAGEAEVNYEWMAVDTCNELGEGSFSKAIPQEATVLVGEIPAGKTGVVIDLEAAAGRDIDIQLWDGPTPLIHWPNGLLSGASEESIEYRGMTLTYSGYNGIDGNWGHERIRIEGSISRTLTMKAYGYQSGTASVDYEWGVGVGDTCGGIAVLQCDEGLFCKDGQGPNVSDPAGSCHTANWCGSNASAQVDCSNLLHIAVPGAWTCETFQCRYQAGPTF